MPQCECYVGWNGNMKPPMPFMHVLKPYEEDAWQIVGCEKHQHFGLTTVTEKASMDIPITKSFLANALNSFRRT